MTSQRVSRLIATLGCALCLLQSCGNESPAPPDSPDAGAATPAAITVRLAIAPFLAITPYYIGMEEGYYEEQGIQVELVRVNSENEILPALAMGEIDATCGIPRVAALNAAARGESVRIVGGGSFVNPDAAPDTAIMMRADWREKAALPDADVLRGARIEASRDSVEAFFLHQLLAGAGLTMKDVQILDLPDAIISEALNRGSIDLAFTSEPWTTRVEQTGAGFIWKPISAFEPHFQHNVILYGKRMLEDDVDAGCRFMVGFLKGLRQFNEGPTPRNVEIAAKVTGLDADLLENLNWPSMNDDGWPYPEGWLRFAQWAYAEGLINVEVQENQLFDRRFWEYAAARIDGLAD